MNKTMDTHNTELLQAGLAALHIEDRQGQLVMPHLI